MKINFTVEFKCPVSIEVEPREAIDLLRETPVYYREMSKVVKDLHSDITSACKKAASSAAAAVKPATKAAVEEKKEETPENK